MRTKESQLRSDEQLEPFEESLDGLLAKFTYSRRWLEDTLDYPSIMNNFIYLFKFSDSRMLLTLPSQRAQLGVLERLRVSGKDAYPVGAAFNLKQQSSLLQTLMYTQFLRTTDIEVESVIAWFFSDYLKAEFGAADSRYAPSSKASTYLEKCRHIFAEMESVARQFTLWDSNVGTRRTPRNCSARETRWSRLGNDSWMAVSTGVRCRRSLGLGAGDSGEIVAREEPHP